MVQNLMLSDNLWVPETCTSRNYKQRYPLNVYSVLDFPHVWSDLKDHRRKVNKCPSITNERDTAVKHMVTENCWKYQVVAENYCVIYN
jgi:hypothetical protein